MNNIASALEGYESGVHIPFGSAPVGESQVTIFSSWSRIQRTNLARHAFGLTPFSIDEFGQGAASPGRSHIKVVNQLLTILRRQIQHTLDQLQVMGTRANNDPQAIAHFTLLKDRGQQLVEATERVWDFYFQLFGQRNSRVASSLFACDRIALDCYQAVYMGLGKARPIPSPPPLSYVASGSGPATYRRGIVIPQLGQLANPFPLIQLPHHRLLNPWTLGAIAHEVSHNLQADLGLWDVLPRQLDKQLRAAGFSPSIARVWSKWHAELFSDLAGVLLIGPAMVASLIGVLAREPERVVRYHSANVHPPGLLRVPISVRLVARLGFRKEARMLTSLWQSLYPSHHLRSLPKGLVSQFRLASDSALSALIYTSYPQLGSKRLVDVVPFGRKEQTITEEAAGRLAAGIDPGIVPERLLIGAARSAIERRLAPPGRIATNFYEALERT